MRKLAIFLCTALALSCGICLGGCTETDERTRYIMQLSYSPEEGELTGEAEISVYNATEEAFSSLSFALLPNAYREGAKQPAVSELYRPAAYYAGESYGGITVDYEGEYELCGEDETTLRIPLAEPLFPDERTTVKLSFQTKLAKVNHRLGVGQSAVNLSFFYPQLYARGEGGWLEYGYSPLGDPFAFECADYEVTLSLPADYSCVFAGEGGVERKGEFAVYRVKNGGARDCAFVVGKDLRSLTASVEGVTVEYCAFGQEPSEVGLQVASESLSYFSRTFGKYPLSRYAVVETDLVASGMEYGGLAMISRTLLEKDIPYVVAHETAHQWWYFGVGSNQVEQAWQDEGLAEYSTALFFENYPAYGYTRERLVKESEGAYRAYFSISSQLKGEANTQMNRPLSAYAGEYEYQNIAYRKGMLLFESLRGYLGERRFFAGLKRYYADCFGTLASPERLSASFTGAGKGAEGLISSFVEGKCVV